MATYRRFHKPLVDEAGFSTVSLVNLARIQLDGSTRPQTIEATQWHAGDEVPEKLNERFRAMLEDGDYIIWDFPEHPSVWKKDDFEANTEFIAD
ncbi:hypothetical protein [Spirosoma luteum]|uniref:hypothetical protein n=1 Tax=Spirosoma luteum TaxID=431553 RepID=UPI00035C54A1|nr:hypothetical protein [Spirosoma luteum]